MLLIARMVYSRLPVLAARSIDMTQAAADGRETPNDYIRGHYTKYEYQVPMRDGTRLMTHVYVPKDDRQT